MKKSLGAKTLVYMCPVYIVGSYDDQDNPNIMNVAWGGICCSEPPCLAIALRKATYTYGNIVRNRAFTVSVPSVAQAEAADYVGIYSGRDEDKFAATGLTPVKSDLVHAPYVDEFPLVVECKVIHTIEIGLHTQFIGEILDVKVQEDLLDENGLPDVAKVQPLTVAPGVMRYYAVGDFVGQAFSIGKKSPARGKG